MINEESHVFVHCCLSDKTPSLKAACFFYFSFPLTSHPSFFVRNPPNTQTDSLSHTFPVTRPLALASWTAVGWTFVTLGDAVLSLGMMHRYWEVGLRGLSGCRCIAACFVRENRRCSLYVTVSWPLYFILWHLIHLISWRFDICLIWLCEHVLLWSITIGERSAARWCTYIRYSI